MAIKQFEDLKIWKISRELANSIYNITSDGAFSKDFGLRDQVRRASVSVMSNIAEGFERDGNQEFIQFLSIAKGSSGEVRSQIYLAVDQGYINEKESKTLIDHYRKLSSMISKFIQYLKGSSLKGTKYKTQPVKSMKEVVNEIVRDAKK